MPIRFIKIEFLLLFVFPLGGESEESYLYSIILRLKMGSKLLILLEIVSPYSTLLYFFFTESIFEIVWGQIKAFLKRIEF